MNVKPGVTLSVGYHPLIVLLAFLSACSPYTYAPEITSFVNSVDTIASAHALGEQAIGNAIAQKWQADRTQARDRLDILPGCDSVDPSGDPPKLEDCAIVKFGEAQSPKPTSVQVHLANDAQLFAALKAYAKALASVSNAADGTALTQAMQGLTSAASGMADAVAKLNGSASSSSVTSASGGLLGQGVSIYLDSRRYAALRKVVPSADAAIGVLGKTVAADLLDIRAQQARQLQAEVHAAARPLQLSTSALSEAEYHAKLAALQAKVAALNQIRAVDPTAIATAMVDAHHQLAIALQNDSGQILPVLNAVTNFASAAEQAKAAFDEAASTTGTATPLTKPAGSSAKK